MGRDPNKTGEILDAVALLVVDMQAPFLDAIPDADAVVARCAFAVEAATLLGIEVIFTEQVPAKLGHTIKPLSDRAPNARFFSKNTFPALQAPGLPEHLKKRGVYHLLLAGIETPICVYQTALQAHDGDLDVTIVSDCVSGRRPDDCRTTLEALSRANCHVLPAEAIYYSMIGSVLHPRFGSFTKLVKHYNLPAPLASRPDLSQKVKARSEESSEDAEPRKSSRRRSRGRARRSKAANEAEKATKTEKPETKAPKSEESPKPETSPEAQESPAKEDATAKPPAKKKAARRTSSTGKTSTAKKKTASTARKKTASSRTAKSGTAAGKDKSAE